MVEWLFVGVIALCLGVALISLVPFLAGKAPNIISLGAAALVEVAIIIQLITTIIIGSASAGFIEIIGYEVAAMFVPLGAVALTTLEKSRRASLVLTLAPLVICVMFVRMWTIWTA